LAYETSLAAMRLAEESGDTYSKACAYSTLGISCYLRGLLKDVEEYSLRAADLGESINFVHSNVGAHFNLGETFFEIGEYQRSKVHYAKAVSILERNRILPSWMNLNKIGVAKAKVMNNERDVDLVTLYGYETENKVRLFDGRMSRYTGEILLNKDDQHMNEAEEWIKKAIESDKRNGMTWYLGRDFALYAELFKRKGDCAKAREILGKAIEILKECGADGWVSKYEKELALIQ